MSTTPTARQGPFTGLSAFPLTPLTGETGQIDEAALRHLIRRLSHARVDSITMLGSTGSYAYLNREERRRVVELAVAEAGDTPVLAGVGALRTREVLLHAADAQAAGAAGVLVAPVSYQPLTEAEVYGLFADVDQESSVPVVVYDNPGTTRFTFTDDLLARIADLPSVASIKIPPVTGATAVQQRVVDLRAMIPDDVTIGISGDPGAADALNAGCDAWYSVLAGTLPAPCQAILGAATTGQHAQAAALSEALSPLWELFTEHGSYRVVSALAEELGLISHPSLPRPVLGLDGSSRRRLRRALHILQDTGLTGLDLPAPPWEEPDRSAGQGPLLTYRALPLDHSAHSDKAVTRNSKGGHHQVRRRRKPIVTAAVADG